MSDVLEHESYPLRFAKSSEGEWCVSVDDLINWLLSVSDGDGASEDQCVAIKKVIDTISEALKYKS